MTVPPDDVIDAWAPAAATPGARYEFRVDPDDWNGTLTQQSALIPDGSTVVEVGCATGFMSVHLRDKGCRVVGIEIDPDARAIAASRGVDVLEADITSDAGVAKVRERAHGRADVVLFGDVLEHLTDPAAALASVRRLLRPDGAVVASIPNVAHGSLRLDLVRGRFRYTDTGLLDRTHVHLFTLDTVWETFAAAGYEIDWVGRSLAPVHGTEGRITEGELPVAVEHAVIADSEAWVYQYVVRARPRGLSWADRRATADSAPADPTPAISGPVALVLVDQAPLGRDAVERRWLVEVAERVRAAGGTLVVWAQDRGIVAASASHRPLAAAGALYVGGHEAFDGAVAREHPDPAALVADLEPSVVVYWDGDLVDRYHWLVGAVRPDATVLERETGRRTPARPGITRIDVGPLAASIVAAVTNPPPVATAVRTPEHVLVFADAAGTATGALLEAGVQVIPVDLEEDVSLIADYLDTPPDALVVVGTEIDAVIGVNRLDVPIERWLPGDTAAAVLRRAALTATWGLAMHHGRLHLEGGDPVAAARAFAAAELLAPGRAGTRNGLGVCCWACGDERAAADHFRAALAIDPALTVAADNLAELRTPA